MYVELIKRNRRLSTCYRLGLETLGSPPDTACYRHTMQLERRESSLSSKETAMCAFIFRLIKLWQRDGFKQHGCQMAMTYLSLSFNNQGPPS
jgi:hypothetical protein